MVTADEAYGQDSKFRTWLQQQRIGYVLAVPRNQRVPTAVGNSRPDVLAAAAPALAWKHRSCGDGAKGPRLYVGWFRDHREPRQRTGRSPQRETLAKDPLPLRPLQPALPRRVRIPQPRPHRRETAVQIFTEREERKAIASNAPFSEWDKTFTEERFYSAIVDRLTFNGYLLEPATTPTGCRAPSNATAADSPTTNSGAGTNRSGAAAFHPHTQSRVPQTPHRERGLKEPGTPRPRPTAPAPKQNYTHSRAPPHTG